MATDENFFQNVQNNLKWFLDRLCISKEKFKDMAQHGQLTHGLGAIMVKVQFDDLMSKNGDRLQVAYVPVSILDEMGSSKAAEDARKVVLESGDFCLVVMSARDSLALVDSCIVNCK